MAEQREAMPLRVTASGVEGIEFQVSQRRVAALRARVQAPGVETSVRVTVVRVENGPAGAAFGSVAQGEVKPDEVFEVSGLVPGRYVITAAAEAAGMGARQRALLYQDVGEGNIDGLVIPLSAGVEVRGRVRIAGRAPGPGVPALPSAGMRVSLEPEPRTGGTPEPAEVRGEDGEFVLRHVTPQSYTATLFGRPPGYQLAEVRYNGTIFAHGVFSIDPGAAEHRLELTLDAASASVALQVSDGLRPSPNAVVVVAREPVLLRLHPDVLVPVEADEEGKVLGPNLLPGSYRAAAWRAGELFLEDPHFADRIRQGARVRAGAGEKARIQVRPHTVIGVLP